MATPSGGPTASALIQEGLRHVGASYSSGAGRTWSASVERPPSFDCSGFVQYLTRRVGINSAYDISNNQYRLSKQAGLELSVEQARKTPGALLFKVGEGANGHVAISLGNGDTLESSGSGGGVRVIKGGANKKYFTKAGMIPGVVYDNAPVGDVSGVVDGDYQPVEGSNNINNDPAYQLARLAALTNGADPKDIDKHTETLYGPSTMSIETPDGGAANTPQAGVAASPQTGATPAPVQPAPTGEPMPTNKGEDVDKFLAAVRQHESGGNYQARYKGPIKSDAAGAYQMLGTTWRSNAKGLSNAATADAATPEEQDAVARKMAEAYYQKFGDWGLAAVAWYGGVGTAEKMQRGEDAGAPAGQGSYSKYRDSILQSMAGS